MRKWLSLIIISVLAIGGTVAMYWYLYQSETRQIEADFQQSIVQRASQLDNELIKLRATMRYWRKFYETSESAINPEQFRKIALDVLGTYPSLQVVAWAPLVPSTQRQAYEQQFKRFNPEFSIFTIRADMNQRVDMNQMKVNQAINVSDPAQFDPRALFAPSGDQPQYFPISVLEPQERVGFLTGLDISSVNILAVSTQIQQTRDSGSSDIVTLPALQSPFSPQREPIFVILVPVYLGDANSTADRRDVLQGFIATIFNLQEFVLNASLADQPRDIGVDVVDVSGDGGLKALAHYGEAIQQQRKFNYPISNVLDRKWEMVASPSDTYIESRRTLIPEITMLFGTIFTGFVLLYIHLMQRQNKIVQAQVDNRTSELRHANNELNVLNERLEQLSRIDSLTEVANRRFFSETLEREWRRAFREKLPITLLMIDVDYFKPFNDEYGHIRGDECLQSVAKTLTGVFKRGGDLVARYGGEEFAVVLPNCTRDAMSIAEQCRQAVAELNIPHSQSEVAEHITISIGMSSVVPNDSISPEILLESADKALYLAKDSGRNKVIFHTCYNPAKDIDSTA